MYDEHLGSNDGHFIELRPDYLNNTSDYDDPVLFTFL
jgi:hypothetical protein